MKLGVCCNLTDAAAVRAAGYDYIEPPLFTLAQMTEAELAQARDTLRDNGLTMDCVNGFFPAHFRLTGTDADFEQIRAYAERALKNAAALGCRIAAIGNGRGRRVPEGFDPDTALRQFTEVASICGRAAQPHGITVCVEELNTAETDLVTTAQQARQVARETGLANVGWLADVFHILRSGGSPADITVAELPAHLHLSNPHTRRLPAPSDDFDYAALHSLLVKNGYHGRVSLEAQFDELAAELKQAAAVTACLR